MLSRRTSTVVAGRYRDREPAPGTAVLNFEKTEEVRRAGDQPGGGGSQAAGST